MSTDQPSEEQRRPVETGFAPADYSDGRKVADQQALKWDTLYPEEARKRIRAEAIYLGVVLLSLFLAFLYCLSETLATESGAIQPPSDTGNPRVATPPSSLFLVYVTAWLSGSIGGTLFSIKWLYHSVAKQIWHKDRLLWRLFTPHMSGCLAFFMVLLVASGVIRIFDEQFFRRVISVVGFGFLVGYFSDKALAKMAEVADTLFGKTEDQIA